MTGSSIIVTGNSIIETGCSIIEIGSSIIETGNSIISHLLPLLGLGQHQGVEPGAGLNMTR